MGRNRCVAHIVKAICDLKGGNIVFPGSTGNIIRGRKHSVIHPFVIEDFFYYIELFSSFNFSGVLARSKVLFEKCVSERAFYLVSFFEENLFNDEFISNNINELINYEFDFLPYKLRVNKEFFNACIDNKKINLLINFDSSLLTNDFLKANIKDFYNYILLTNYVPFSLIKNEILFQECLVNKNYNLLLKFDNSLLENGVLEEHCDEIYNFVVISNNLPPLLDTNKIFFDKCIYEIARRKVVYCG